jgi:2'-5' RNA ligase
VPAHVTLLYPFKPPVEIDTQVIEALAKLFSSFQSFDTSFSRVKRFPGVLYLAPEPDEAFRHLTASIAKQFPEAPPYGGRFNEVVPHLTVADLNDSDRLDAVANDFETAAKGRLPIHAYVREVCLIDNQSGRWVARQRFVLAER